MIEDFLLDKGLTYHGRNLPSDLGLRERYRTMITIRRLRGLQVSPSGHRGQGSPKGPGDQGLRRTACDTPET